jgi:hypothetical protein
LHFRPHLSPYPWSSNFREPRQGEVHHSSGPEGPVPPPAATEKPGRSGRGKVQRVPGLTINQIVVSTRPRAHTPNGLSLYARWPLSRVLQRSKVQARSKRTGVERGQGMREPGRDGGGKPRPDYGLPNLTSWPLRVVNIRCSGVKARFDAGRCVL